MSPPEMRNGAPPQGPATRKISPTGQQDTQHGKDATAVRVSATFLRPSARRGLPALVVRCPLPGCGGVHLHRGGGGLRRAGCGRGSYVIVPIVDEQLGAAA